jgi:ABC-2 type transport system permease protein
MRGHRPVWLVARREVRERSRSKAFRAGLVAMLLLVVASIAFPALVENDDVAWAVGFAGTTPDALPATVTDQGETVDVTVDVHRYDGVDAGVDAVRAEDIDVLVVDSRRLLWRGDPDERLRAVVTGAIQLVAVQARAAAAGIDPDELLALVAPVPVDTEELGLVEGGDPDNETAAAVMSILLFFAVIMYGNLVLIGVAEEKANRVVEVLLARIPARELLAGKVAGIGLLGFGQFLLTALAALVAAAVVDSVDIPAVSAGVLAWVVVWFVLGYALYAMAYGALGSLASRTEDASAAAGPASYVLIAAYWVAYIVVANDPESLGSKLVSVFPATAPFAMPGRIALDVTAWWEPFVAAATTIVALAGLVVLAGRVYTAAVLHAGPTLTLRDAWRRATRTDRSPERAVDTRKRTVDRSTILALLVSVGLGVVVGMLLLDVIIGVTVGSVCFAAVTRVKKAGPDHPPASSETTEERHDEFV